MKKSIAIFTALWALSLLGYVGGVFLLSAIVSRWPAVGPFVFVDTHGNAKTTFWNAAVQPGGFLAVLAFCLAIDAACVGLENSAVKRLIEGKSPSARVDAFYVLFKVAGGVNLLAFLFSFGLLFWLVNHIHRVLHINVLQYIHSAVIQFIIVYLVNTFIAYWGHRLMHTKWMWEIHKVHHAAEEMNVVTPFRNHPVDHVINSTLNAFPVALLGAAPHVIVIYYAVNMVYQSMVHSEIRLKSKFWDYIWITPAAHRVHHSNRQEHFDTNFGIVTLWDWVFGTYKTPTNEKLQYGVEGGDVFNRKQHIREVFANVRRWIRGPVSDERLEQISDLPPVSFPVEENVEPARGFRKSA